MSQINHDRIREALGKVTVERAAAECGVSSTTVRNWLAGTSIPRSDRLPAIAALARRSVSWLFTDAA